MTNAQMFRRIVERIPLAWLYLPLLVVSSIFIFGGPSSPGASAAGRFAFAIAVGGVVCQIFRWKAALGFLAVLAVVYCACAIFLVKVACFLLLAGGPVALVVGGGVIVLPLLMLTVPLAVITTGFVALKISPAWSKGAVATAVLFGLLAGAVPSERGRPYRAFEPQKLEPDIETFDKCAYRYAESHPQAGFPSTLRDLGPAGIGCLPAAMLADRYKGYEIIYQPGPQDSSGKVTSYRVQAIEKPRAEEYAMISSDQAGLVFVSYPGPKGGGYPYLQAPAQGLIHSLIHCLARAQPGANVIDKRAVADLYVSKCLEHDGISGGEGRATEGAFNGQYELEFGPGGVTGFILRVGPAVYGEGGIRSYLVVASHVSCVNPERVVLRAYATPKDRPATTSDPAPDRGEFKNFERGEFNNFAGCQ